MPKKKNNKIILYLIIGVLVITAIVITIFLLNSNSNKSELQKKITDKDTQISKLATEINKKKEDINKKKSDIQNKKKQISGLTTDIQNKEKQISGLTTNIQNKETQISGLTTNIQNKETQISGLNNKLNFSCDSDKYISTLPTVTNDGKCSPIKQCATGQYIASSNTSTTDKVCKQMKTCDDNQYGSVRTDGQATTDQRCKEIKCDMIDDRYEKNMYSNTKQFRYLDPSEPVGTRNDGSQYLNCKTFKNFVTIKTSGLPNTNELLPKEKCNRFHDKEIDNLPSNRWLGALTTEFVNSNDIPPGCSKKITNIGQNYSCRSVYNDYSYSYDQICDYKEKDRYKATYYYNSKTNSQKQCESGIKKYQCLVAKNAKNQGLNTKISGNYEPEYDSNNWATKLREKTSPLNRKTTSQTGAVENGLYVGRV